MPQKVFLPVIFLLFGSAVSSFAAQGKNVYGHLPLSFEANRGQAPADVDYLSRGQGQTLLLSQDRAELILAGESIHLTFTGASGQAKASPQDRQEGLSNYYLESDSKHWLTGIPNFASVEYPEIYPGISLAYHGEAGQLEYDFVLAPDANPSQIGISFRGMTKIEISGADLHLLLPSGRILVQKKPVIFQNIQGEHVIIEGRYIRRSENSIGFEIAPYDHTKPLIIDPVLGYSTFLPGTITPMAMKVDQQGNAYVCGVDGTSHTIVMKLNSTGTAVLYTTSVGKPLFSPPGDDVPAGLYLALDPAGNAYVTGRADNSVDFPTTSGAFQLTRKGFYDSFLFKLDQAGALSYSTLLGSGGMETSTGIAVDNSGAAYVSVVSKGAFPLPATPGAFLTVKPNTNTTVFLAKFNPAGSALTYGTYVGGSLQDYVADLALDSAGVVTITGKTTSGNTFAPLPTPGTVDDTGFAGITRSFVSVINASGTGVIRSAFVPATLPRRVAVDSNGNIYVRADSALIKLNAALTSVLYRLTVSGNGPLAIDSQGNAITGNGGGSAETSTPDALLYYPTANSDAFVVKVDGAGAVLYKSYLPVSQFAVASGLNGDIHVSGNVTSLPATTFPTTPGAISSEFLGDPAHGGGAFATRILMNSNCTVSVSQPDVVNIPQSEAAFGLISVAAGPNCTWTASSDQSWVTLTDHASGTGNGTVAYSLPPSSSSPRTAKIYVGPHIYTINQGKNGCSFVVTPGSANTVEGGPGSASIKANATNCLWTIPDLNPASWITITSAASGLNNGSFSYTLAPNPSLNASRSATFLVGGVPFTMVQPGCVYSVPSSIQKDSNAFTDTLTVQTTASCPRTVSSGDAWLQVSNGNPGSGTGSVAYSAAANTAGLARTGTLTVGNQTVTVIQSGTDCSFQVDPRSVAAPAVGLITGLQISSPGNCVYGPVPTRGWATTTTPATISGPITLTIGQNKETAPRTASINIFAFATGSARLPIIQHGANGQIFDDVPVTHDYLDYIQLMKTNAITTGCSATPSLYCPDASTTRGQMAVFIIRSLLHTEQFPYSVTPYFDDVPVTHPYFAYIQKMKELGITQGCSATPSLYCPNAPVTRGQMAAFLIRANYHDQFSFRTTPYFTDVPATDPYFSYVQKMRELGITTGCTTQTYCPGDVNTRGQMAVFLIRSFFTP